MTSERVEFAGHSGGNLAGRLELPDGSPVACAVFAHCFTCSKDVFASARIARGLASTGIAVLRFDFTGLGQSGGEFGETTFSSNVADLISAADYLRGRLHAPSLLIGHSLGGAAVLAAASQVAECRAVATIGAPAEPAHVEHLLIDGEDDGDGTRRVSIGGRSFRLAPSFETDLRAHSGVEHARTLGRALMIFHSPTDETVGDENAKLIYDAARHPKELRGGRRCRPSPDRPGGRRVCRPRARSVGEEIRRVEKPPERAGRRRTLSADGDFPCSWHGQSR